MSDEEKKDTFTEKSIEDGDQVYGARTVVDR